jgi:hypothetical protein
MSDVVCAECGATVPAAEVEITGLGWRCRKCSLRHQIDVHQGADDQVGQISIPEMQERARKALLAAIGAVAAACACALLLAAGVFSDRVAARAFWAVPAGIAFAGYELVTWRRARKAVVVMQARAAEHQ